MIVLVIGLGVVWLLLALQVVALCAMAAHGDRPLDRPDDGFGAIAAGLDKSGSAPPGRGFPSPG